MELLHLLHLILIAAWAGLVLTEGVIELAASDELGLRAAARLHYWIDMLLELPLLVAIAATGVALAARAWPLTSLHWVKIGAAAVALAANFACVAVVVRRHRRAGDVAELRRSGRLVRLTAAVGVPFGVVAVYLGLRYFRG